MIEPLVKKHHFNGSSWGQRCLRIPLLRAAGATVQRTREMSLKPKQEFEKHGSIHSTENPQGYYSGGHEPVDLIPDGTLDPVYQAKARVLNEAIQHIGTVIPARDQDPLT